MVKQIIDIFCQGKVLQVFFEDDEPCAGSLALSSVFGQPELLRWCLFGHF